MASRGRERPEFEPAKRFRLRSLTLPARHFTVQFMSFTDFAGALLNGLSFSAILILVALGLAITFGVMRVINMAHGEMLMLGAYTAYVLKIRRPCRLWCGTWAG